jgi:hypothetical protein
MTVKRPLFHYCTIDTLRSILTNSTLRFQSLQCVDDPQEAEIYGSERMGRVGFVSCWTDTADESIPMWREYTGSNQDSIRIETTSELFDGEPADKALNTASVLCDKYDFAISPPYKPVLFPVTYTYDESLLRPHLMTKNKRVCECGNQQASWSMNTRLLGRFKSMAWSTQQEWRFLLIALPMEFHRQHLHGDFLAAGNTDAIFAAEKEAIETISLPSPYIDYPIDTATFGPISITLHPNMTELGLRKLEGITHQFNLTSTVMNSELRFR